MSKILLALMLAAGFMGQANAALIVDTGAVENGTGWTLVDWQYFGGKFSINSAQTINAIDSYFNVTGSGSLNFSIHANGGNVPGSVLYTTSDWYGAGSAMGWHGVSGLNWNLAAGDYWVSFRPDATFYGAVPGNHADGALCAGLWQLRMVRPARWRDEFPEYRRAHRRHGDRRS